MREMVSRKQNIEHTRSTAMHDILTKTNSDCVQVLDKGFVKLVDIMPRLVPDGQTADSAIVQAARVSYGDGTKTINEDEGLIRYLLRHGHTTPLEMVEFKFLIKLPIFCARQMIRHRTANVNEYSGRYSVMKDEFYIPDVDNIRQQSKTNKQGGDDKVSEETADAFKEDLQHYARELYDEYTGSLDKGISREQARMVLSLNLYTEWYWKTDLHNLLHFLGLRCDPHAQWEMRQYAEAMLKLIEPITPIAVRAWNDYHHLRGALKLTALEVDVIKRSIGQEAFLEAAQIKSENKREREEWVIKAKRLGIEVRE